MRLVIVAAATAALAFSGCSASRSGDPAGFEQPVVTIDASSTPRPPISLRPTPGRRSATAPTRLVMGDRAGDVLQKPSDGEGHSKRVSYPRGDLRRVTITHGPLTIDVVAQFGDLRPTGSQLFEVQLRALHRKYYGDGVLTRDDRTALSLQWESQYRGSTFTLRCPAASGRANFTRNLVVIAVPTTCLDTPPWVRLTVWNTLDDPGGADYTDGLDDVEIQSDGFTPRVYRR